jgi:hypothetical protein
MELLSAIALAAGVGFVALVALAMLVAGWETLRHRELLDQLRRDRALYAATSPLPLMGGGSGADAAGEMRRAIAAANAPSAGPSRRDASWTETRPMVLKLPPAADDNTAARRSELDLQLD